MAHQVQRLGTMKWLRTNSRRRDATGHLNPQYAADLHARSGKTSKGDAPAFLVGLARSDDSLAERLGEEFVLSATTGGSEAERGSREDFVSEELGGPFVITSVEEGVTDDPDGSGSSAEGSAREPRATPAGRRRRHRAGLRAGSPALPR